VRFKKLIAAIDSHTEGQSTRMIIGGIPNILGRTMAEKRDFVKQNLDYLRTSLLHEPRGVVSPFGCILTPPVTDEAAFGVIWMQAGMQMEPTRYIDMCGHGTIGVATTAVEMGIVEPVEPITEIIIDTPAGIVRAKVNVDNGRAKSVTLQNVPSFLYKTGVIKVPDLGELPFDIAYGGNNYAIVEAKDLGITTSVADIKRARDVIVQIITSFNQQVEIRHPEKDYIKGISMILVSDKPTSPKASVRNIEVGSSGGIDRSPCATGTCARMATEYAKGKLNLGETFVTESITGTLFYGKLVKEVNVSGLKAVIPEVTGSAFITGIHHFVIDEDDPFKYGFRL